MLSAELPCTWYKKDEYAGFRKSMKKDISTFRRTKDLQLFARTTNYCIRGLEKHCYPKEHEDIKNMKRLRIEAVLDQQSFQRAMGLNDPHTLGLVAEVLSNRSCNQALVFAAMDVKNCE
jgi:hypothetical protein